MPEMKDQANKNVCIFLYEIRLSSVQNINDDGLVSQCDYGKHVVGSLEDIFDTKFKSIGSSKSAAVASEVLSSQDGATLLSFRMYERNAAYFLTLTLELLESNAHVIDISKKCQDFFEDERKKLSEEDAKNLAPDQQIVHYMPPIKRGFEISPYFTTSGNRSDDRICHYNIKKVLYDVRSKYQHIQIVDLVDQGATLFLDGMVNLGECDTIGYTHALMDIPKETSNYDGSRVLILGGGDGGLLKELLELPKPPKQVTMIDLDDEVLVGCAQHMRSVCGPYLDNENRKGYNYEVICGDAIEYMEKAEARGEKYDFIFGDMTDVPVKTDPSEDEEDLWKFFKHILELTVQLLKPNTGKFLTHCTGKSSSKTLADFEAVVKSLRVKNDPTLQCTFTQTESFVQSFLEIWVFYQISMVTKG